MMKAGEASDLAVERSVGEPGQAGDRLLRVLIENAADAYFLHDVEGRFLDVNRQACHSLGYSREELLRRGVGDVERGLDLDEARRAWTTVVPGHPATLSGLNRRKDGSTFPVEVRSTCVEVGGERRFLSLVRDVSEQRRAQAELLESREVLGQTLDAIAVGVIRQDAQGAILDCNPAAERILGLTADQLRGLTSVDPRWSSVHEDGSPFPGEAHPAMVALRTGAPVGAVIMGVRKPGGALTWIDVGAVPITGPDGRARSVVVTFADVTERKRALDALRESQENMALFVRFAPAAIALFDRDMRYLAVSQRYLGDYRLADQAVVGRSHYELFPEIPERWKAIHRRCLAGAVERCEEDPFPRADGRTDWVRWEIHPWRDAAGAVGGIVLFSEVVTERKEMEALRARSERLGAVTTLVRGLSHEINNPLASVMSNLDYALEQLRAVPDRAAASPAGGPAPMAELREALVDALGSAGQIKSMVKALHAFLPHGGQVVQLADVSRAMRQALQLVAQELKACAEVAVELPPLPEVPLAEAELVQVFVSLLGNAGRATGSGPNRLKISAHQAGPDRVVVTIADTGTGMAPEVLDHIFEPFFTTRGIGEGKGLGVPLCRGIIDSAGGEISYRSAVGQGTTVTVVLPAVGEATASGPKR